jgi:hypothetical protein
VQTPSAFRQVDRRRRQAGRILHDEGWRALVGRGAEALVRRTAPATSRLEVRPADVLAADLSVLRPVQPWAPAPGPDDPLVLNWVTTPPARGSGGHTTTFRMIRYFERAGHTCRVYLYDVHGNDAEYFGPVLREFFPGLRAEVLDIDQGLADAHVTFATSWPTAYPVHNAGNRGLPCYLVQDYEPWFYAVGSQSVLADNTYRMGLRGLTAGRWLSGKLAAEYGMDTASFDFGCDTDRYHLLEGTRRDGIVFYARPETPRRAYEIGLMALELFAAQHPTVPIHVYGASIGRQAFSYVDHGVTTPEELNRIYNRCAAGLSLSMTNVSLVPHEMLAAGCIPVVNDAEHNRLVLDNPHVRYVAPEPHALAAALGELVTSGDLSERSATASSSVRSASWDDAGAAAVRAVREWLASWGPV